jgi:phosphoribosylformylglycinamidine (FGAM) synthase-like amidotransferase family enzyme
MSTSLAVIEKDGFVSLTQNLENLEQIMGKFGLSCRELDKLMENEYHHFACQMTGTRIIRVYTKHCVFTINLDSARAAVAASETVWMHAIMIARDNERVSKELAEKLKEDLRYEQRQVEIRDSEIARWRGSYNELKAAKNKQAKESAALTQQLKAWKSRAMKMVARCRVSKKPQTKKGKAK